MAEGENNEVVVPVQVPDQTGHVVDIDHTERLVRLEQGLQATDDKIFRSMDDLRSDFSRQLDDIRSGVAEQLGGMMTKLDELTPAAPETPAPAAPDVETNPAEPPTKKVRRGGRKVTRRG